MPYVNLVHTLHSAYAAGVRNATFKVRKMGGVADLGWLKLNGFKVIQETEDLVTFDTVANRPWSDFVNVWDEVYMGCRSGTSGNCLEKTVKVAEGGDLQITLYIAVVKRDKFHSKTLAICRHEKEVPAMWLDLKTRPHRLDHPPRGKVDQSFFHHRDEVFHTKDFSDLILVQIQCHNASDED